MINTKPVGPKQTSSQKAQKAQPGGPTIGGVAGVGKQKLVSRPNSSRRPSIVRGHTTKPSASGIGEGKESEFTANQHLHNTVKTKILTKLQKPNPQKQSGGNDYFSYNAKKTMKEEAPAMSISGGAVPSITNPTVNYALQKKMKEKIARRKKSQ